MKCDICNKTIDENKSYCSLNFHQERLSGHNTVSVEWAETIYKSCLGCDRKLLATVTEIPKVQSSNDIDMVEIRDEGSVGQAGS